jgi:RNA polymerase sigma-70 factor (ECF subfamily)
MGMMLARGRTNHGAAMIRSSDLDDFGAFYVATYQRAYRTAFAIVGESALAGDVVQDAFVSAFRNRARFRGDGPAEAWLTRIVVNAAISATRRRRVRWMQPLPANVGAHGDEPARSVDRLSIVAALQVLSPRERAAVVLRFYHGYDYATIARCLDTNSGTVGSWLSRAMGQLRAELNAVGNEGSSPVASEGRDVR